MEEGSERAVEERRTKLIIGETASYHSIIIEVESVRVSDVSLVTISAIYIAHQGQ